jgi:hypothetical protein
MRIRCETLFDCSATGVTGHFRSSQMPLQDAMGRLIENQIQWTRARNQQRNWETLLQILGLRCQLQDIAVPQHRDHKWCFEFTVEQSGVLDEQNDFAAIKRDCEGVPMILDLDETAGINPAISTTGPLQNIWFQTLNIE